MDDPLTTKARLAWRARIWWILLAGFLVMVAAIGLWSALTARGVASSGLVSQSPDEADGRRMGPAGRPAGGPATLASSDSSAPLPVGEKVPGFTLVDATGRRVARSDLDGKIWIANFIFTRCPDVCPALSRKMAEVRKGLEADGNQAVISVSFTVDPKYDTPDVLERYAAGFGADPSSWLFLTGDSSELLRLINEGFRLIMVDPEEGPPAHSNRFVLVDSAGRVRSTHTGTEDDLVGTIVREARALREESRS